MTVAPAFMATDTALAVPCRPCGVFCRKFDIGNELWHTVFNFLQTSSSVILNILHMYGEVIKNMNPEKPPFQRFVRASYLGHRFAREATAQSFISYGCHRLNLLEITAKPAS